MAAYFIETQVVLPYITNLPRDVAVNTWHFRAVDGTSPATAAADAATVLTAFYNTLTPTIQSVTIGAYLSAQISRASNACRFKTYDLSDPLPRAPIGNSTWTLVAAGADTSYPAEIALCGSYRAAYSSGIPAASRRGRVYLGPFNTTAPTAASGQPARPSTALQANVAKAMSYIPTRCAATSLTWIQFSRKLQAGNDVVAGWVDDEWDVQRRRGRVATARSTW